MKLFRIAAILVVAALGSSQTLVKANQGQPGNQGPWPVTLQGTSGLDGGTVGTMSCVCKTTRIWNGTLPGLDAGAVPADGGLAGRSYIRVCNAPSNPGTPQIYCTDDGQTPSSTAGSLVGESLQIGDCNTYAVSASKNVACAPNITSTQVTSYECVCP